MSQRKECLEDAINSLQKVKHLLEKELQYDYSVTDDIQTIIEHLEFDLGEME